jgi:hypothetical protein
VQRRLLSKEIGVDFDKTLPLVRHCRLFKDGSYGTGRLTSSTINTLIRIDIELLSILKSSSLGEG